MIDELEYKLPGFSKVNHTRCFLHVNNLVAQTFVRQFDTPTKPKTSSRDDLDDPNDVLYKLAKDIDLEERETREALLKDAGEDVPDDDDNDGWIDETAALSQAERDVLEESLRPVKLILVKVSGQSQYKDIENTHSDFLGSETCI